MLYRVKYGWSASHIFQNSSQPALPRLLFPNPWPDASGLDTPVQLLYKTGRRKHTQEFWPVPVPQPARGWCRREAAEAVLSWKLFPPCICHPVPVRQVQDLSAPQEKFSDPSSSLLQGHLLIFPGQHQNEVSYVETQQFPSVAEVELLLFFACSFPVSSVSNPFNISLFQIRACPGSESG